ncbi:hypothetical protein Ocepr_2358 (plasmid) [Oceanithermus profundus DSM 14977]|uniref:Peptidase S8/S53 domain-containing protein n=1 Tax=Oceanithermus profundus (strain DSM 14977 / NBRC 100410 / VKM B-2274 / 506) TaxID=670487 RepID=E4UAM7_OCEP5|nr:hypothetical protein [Oceanithermus profundus]ADR37806.1 hypothetical protein Ocepr_2358 [Oceanithermus profundus DSM 14977]
MKRVFFLFTLTLLLTACPGPQPPGGDYTVPDVAYSVHPLFMIDRPFAVRPGGWTEVWLSIVPEPRRDVTGDLDWSGFVTALGDRKVEVTLDDAPSWITNWEALGTVGLSDYHGLPEWLDAWAYAVRLELAPDAPAGDHRLRFTVHAPTPRSGEVTLRVIDVSGATCGQPGPGLPDDPSYWRNAPVPDTFFQYDLGSWIKSGTLPPAGPDRPLVWAWGLEEAWVRLPDGCDPVYVVAPDSGGPDARIFWTRDFDVSTPQYETMPYAVRSDVTGAFAPLDWWMSLSFSLDLDNMAAPGYPPNYLQVTQQGQAICSAGDQAIDAFYDPCHGNGTMMATGGTWNDGYGVAGLFKNVVKWVPMRAGGENGGFYGAALNSTATEYALTGSLTMDGQTFTWPGRTPIVVTAAVGAPSQGDCDALAAARARGQIAVYGAGNNLDYLGDPAGCPDAIAAGSAVFSLIPGNTDDGSTDWAGSIWARAWVSSYGDNPNTPWEERMDFVVPGQFYTPDAFLPDKYGFNVYPWTSPATHRLGGLIGLYLYSNRVWHGDPYRGLWGTADLYTMVYDCLKAASSNYDPAAPGEGWDVETGWGVPDPAKIVDPSFAACHGG